MGSNQNQFTAEIELKVIVGSNQNQFTAEIELKVIVGSNQNQFIAEIELKVGWRDVNTFFYEYFISFCRFGS